MQTRAKLILEGFLKLRLSVRRHVKLCDAARSYVLAGKF